MGVQKCNAYINYPIAIFMCIHKLIRLSRKTSKATVAELQNEWNMKNISLATVQRIFKKIWFSGPYSCKEAIFNHILWRKKWRYNYIKLDKSSLDQTFNDEFSLELQPNRQQYVRMLCNTKYLGRYITKTIKHGGIPIMLWGSIKSDCTRALIRCPNQIQWSIKTL